jgi:predicted metal-dependent HD superfamily phosphohydrolase
MRTYSSSEQELRAFWAKDIFHPDCEEYRAHYALTDYHANQTFDWLMSQYQEPHRYYHNLNHLHHLFSTPTSNSGYNRSLPRTLFFFFHDSIYNIPSTTNEEDSMAEFESRIRYMGFVDKSNEIIKIVSDAISLSKHTEPCNNPLQQELLDADLSILGVNPQDYHEYLINIRNEYGVVPQSVWHEKRGEFLEFMLSKPKIFQSTTFHPKYEEQARQNMSEELKKYTR